MRVGMDTISLSSMKLDPLGLLDKVIEYNLEGMQLGAHELLDRPVEYRQEVLAKIRKHNLYIDVGGSGVNPRNSGKSVAEMVELWKPLFPIAAEFGSKSMGTCFGLYHERTMTSPTFSEMYEMTTQVLKALMPMAKDYGVAVCMENHIDLTTDELVQLMETVDSEFVGIQLDTANALGLFEDPIYAAEKLAPFAKTTHFKDTCIYPTDEGFNWNGGAPLCTGLVDLVTVTKLLFKYNPDIHLNIEDGWGYIPIPMYDEALMRSLAFDPAKMATFFSWLRKGDIMMHAGMHPRADELKNCKSVPAAMQARMFHSARAVRQLRDDAEGIKA